MKRFYPNLRKAQLKVGVFTVVILAVLVVGYLWLSNRISTHVQHDLRVSFDDVMGLEIGDQVTYRGMEVGRVKKIEARDQDILVTTRVNSKVTLKEGSRFIISDSGLMGGTVMNITQGQGPGALDTKRIMTGDSPVGLMGAVSRAALAIDGLNSVFASLREEGGLIDRSAAVLDNARQAVGSVDELAVSAQADLQATLDQIEKLAAEARLVVQSGSANLDSALSQAPGTMANVNAALDSLKSLSSRLEQSVSSLNTSTSTAGRLMRDDELYRQLQSSVASLDSLVQDVRANPKKYLKFSIF